MNERECWVRAVLSCNCTDDRSIEYANKVADAFRARFCESIDDMEWRETDISELGLSVRSYKALIREGYNTIGKIQDCKRRHRKLSNIVSNFGNLCDEEVDGAISRYRKLKQNTIPTPSETT